MSWWTSTTEANQDYFARNISTCRRVCGSCCLCLGSSSVGTDEFDTVFDPGGCLVPWPTVPELSDWGIQNGWAPDVGEDTTKPAAAILSLQAAKYMMAQEFGLSLAEDATIRIDVALMTLIQASFYYFHKDAANGTVGSDEVTQQVLAGATHPLVEAFLMQNAPIGLG